MKILNTEFHVFLILNKHCDVNDYDRNMKLMSLDR